ncbi:ribonucleoside-triphosphate reductase, adenosylcobalamin-dependent [Streptomyces sp. CBMA29]|uniref:ribonucleoside-triphosphate reductase, adenosylcobalamin-dependent n=1 Tax=Streptomyces sp. CBMA29 TaxID=1896314 RepID=UPI00166207C3|nr:ribonucleoside-triphosphate reductase, adenosylcobalamin-dependent [Streptomyces sp. CBMA29]MBD0739861.1 ribonucleoside-triphosphate reductase, adenosylcobalamin-dependent [Streptomyces sp. CBMA29]
MTEFSTETARIVYERTYRREKPDGELETWPETVARVVDGNLKLVPPRYIEPDERAALMALIESFRVLPAGRHLKSSGVNNFALNNCWAAGWDAGSPAEHFVFTLLRLAEGGGVGSNYSNSYLRDFPQVENAVRVHIVCDPDHPDYEDMKAAGLLSSQYAYTWFGAFGVEDSRDGWASALGDLITTAHDQRTQHEDRVYDVSRVRRKGAPLRSFGGTASGPAPFAQMLIRVGEILTEAAGWPLSGLDAMEIDHEIAQCIVSGGVRRSARMSIMHWSDSQIEDFLYSKQDASQHWTTNISVEVDTEFIAYARGEETKEPWKAAQAAMVLEELATGALGNGEPGFWNSSLSADGEVDGTYTTNPCGEATLNQWEPCNLGSVNLGAFVDISGVVDHEALHEAHRLVTRYLIRGTFAAVADVKSAEAIAKYRRIGVGHLGFADYLAGQGIRYSEASHDRTVIADLVDLAQTVDEASAEYANELRIPRPIKSRVVAPTGTISKLAGASGEGVHAPFADYFLRRIRFSMLEPVEVRQVEEYQAAGYDVEPCIYAANTMVVSIPTMDPLVSRVLDDTYVQHSGQLDLREMLAVQELYQTYWADQAVSYTASVDPAAYSVDQVAEVLLDYMPVLKGTTIFPEMSRDQAPYQRISKAEYLEKAYALGINVADTSYEEFCARGGCPV